MLPDLRTARWSAHAQQGGLWCPVSLPHRPGQPILVPVSWELGELLTASLLKSPGLPLPNTMSQKALGASSALRDSSGTLPVDSQMASWVPVPLCPRRVCPEHLALVFHLGCVSSWGQCSALICGPSPGLAALSSDSWTVRVVRDQFGGPCTGALLPELGGSFMAGEPLALGWVGT